MKTQTELNADTRYVFEQTLKNKDTKIECFFGGIWQRTTIVTTAFPHRIYHDIPEGWTRHDGEDWKGDSNAVLEEIMTHDGMVSPNKNQTAAWWSGLHANNFTAENHSARIYAYKLAAKSPEIPNPTNPCRCVITQTNGVIAWIGGDMIPRTPEYLATYFLQLDGSVCGKEVEQ